MTLNHFYAQSGHFALNSVLPHMFGALNFWTFEAWISKLAATLKLVVNVVGEL